jgi:hypothetical protein
MRASVVWCWIGDFDARRREEQIGNHWAETKETSGFFCMPNALRSAKEIPRTLQDGA